MKQPTKQELQRLLEATSYNIAEVARHLGKPRRTVSNWVEKYELKHSLPALNSCESGLTVLVVPDLHEPFSHPDAYEFLKAVMSEYDIDKVVLLGDEVDFHAFSRYPANPDGYSPGHELKAAREAMLKWYRLFHAYEVKVCVSNHAIRGHKKGFESSIPAAFFREYEMVIDAPDTWEWAQEHEIDGVVYRHGDPKHGANTCKRWVDETYKSSINGHTHSHAQVRYFASGNGLLIGGDFGCLIDATQYAFAYSKGHRPPTLGCGIVKEGLSAYFIPMHCENGRWIKRIV